MPPGGHVVFRLIKFLLAISVEGCLVTISVKLFLILTTGFRDGLQSFLHRYIRETGHTPWQPFFLMDQISFSYFCIGSPSDHFRDFSSNFGKRPLAKIGGK